MIRVSARQARARLSGILDDVEFRGARVTFTRRGRPVAAVVPLEDLALLEHLEDREDRADLKAAVERLNEAGPRVPWSVLRAELGR